MLKNNFVGVRRSLVAFAAVAATAVTLIGASPAAHAQPALPNSSQGSSNLSFDDVLNDTRENAWNTRNAFLTQIKQVNPQAAATVRPVLDNAIDAVFPGLRAQKEREDKERLAAIEKQRSAERAAEKARAEDAARKAEAERKRHQFNVGPCPADADVCVDLDGRRTWLQDNGNITYVAPAMSSGKRGQETPRGTFHVVRKVKDDVSYEFDNAPMPYAIYFTNQGHAFHLDTPANESAGCVHLTEQAAVRYWNDLHIGDKVFIY